MPDASRAKVTCTLALEFATAKEASQVLEAVDLDNQGYIDARLDGNKVVATMRTESLDSLLHTLDDFLACVSVAEKIISG
ncbi:MAG: hypothetical protein JSV94_05770 [Methanobacteriota archaeon]|nr:MAG: hypothetical protein JSV94_05770 [Euryarchaeota archaeon]